MYVKVTAEVASKEWMAKISKSLPSSNFSLSSREKREKNIEHSRWDTPRWAGAWEDHKVSSAGVASGLEETFELGLLGDG